MSTSSNRTRYRDTGMAMVLLCLLVYLFTDVHWLIYLALGLLLLNMLWPQLYRPLAFLWFGLADVLGTIVSRILLTILFFCLVVPVGLLRRCTKADPMKLRRWRDGSGSVLDDRPC